MQLPQDIVREAIDGCEGLRNRLQPLGVGTEDVADNDGVEGKASEMKPITISHCKIAIDHWA